MYVKLWPTELVLRNSLNFLLLQSFVASSPFGLGIAGLNCSVMTSALSLQCCDVAGSGSGGGDISSQKWPCYLIQV